jgi:ATP-dependent helicase/nuclease subunit A
MKQSMQAQLRASDPGSSVWVAANAGSGKTHVLTNRIARLLLSGTPPERILCLTFTKAAAAEMSSRLYKRLGRWAVMEDEKLAHDIVELDGVQPDAARLARARCLFARAIETPGGLKIQTLHAFCERLLGRFPLEASVPPNFEILDERRAQELMEEVRDYVLALANREADSDLGKALAHVVAYMDEESFGKILKEIAQTQGLFVRLKQQYGDLNGAVRATRAALGVAPDESAEDCRKDLFGDEFPEVGLRMAVVELLQGSPSDVKQGERILPVLEASLRDESQRNDYLSFFFTGTGEPRKDICTRKFSANHRDLFSLLETERDRVLAHVAHLKSIQVTEATEAILHLSDAVLETYARAKRIRALLDYDDLILRARDLLILSDMAPWVLYKLDGGIDHILVDEAQDTSPMQWEVIAALAEEFMSGKGAREITRTIFVVGDEKQSIFSFQGADPKSFDTMRDYFKRRVESAEQIWSPERLVLSFRSAPEILRAVDAVFADKAPARLGLTMSEDPVLHAANRDEDAGLVELWEPELADGREAPDPWDAPLDYMSESAPAAKLARRIAQTIAGWLQTKEILLSKARPIEPGDILILVRRRNAFVDELVKQLKERRVPVAGRDRMVLTEQIAVMDLLVLGHFVLLPEDDLTLATLLKTPMVGLDDEDLFALAHRRKARSLWSELRERADEKASWRRARDLLDRMLARADYAPPYEFFAHFLDSEGGRRAALTRLGEGAADPMDEFLALALEYERDHPPSLQGFLQWTETGGAEIKRDMEQGRNEVRIMTVHGAKGLEAEIVFMPDTCLPPDGKNDPQLLRHELDEMNELLLWPVRRAMEDTQSAAARQRSREAQAREYRRLLYVAMTRARDRLYIGGYLARNAKAPADSSWYSFIANALIPLAQEIVPDIGPKIWRISGEQKRVVTLDETQAASTPSPLPDWAGVHAPREPLPSRPLAPSRLPPQGMAETPAQSPLAGDARLRFQRGRLIHRLLQTLPELALELRENAAHRFLSSRAHDLDEEAQVEIRNTVFTLLEHPDFAPIFAAGSRAEVPLVGRISFSGVPFLVSGQLDRLCVGEREVLIVDYKTNRPPPVKLETVPAAYIAQMAAYRALLQQIYPAHQVRCALLWTEGPRLMELPEHALEAALGAVSAP